MIGDIMNNASICPVPGPAWGPYPQQDALRVTGTTAGWLKRGINSLRSLGDQVLSGQYAAGLNARVERIERDAREMTQWSDRRLAAQTRRAQRALVMNGLHPRHIDNALAVVSVAAGRTLGVSPYTTQLTAALILLNNQLAEMATGEGKTLACALAASVAALARIPVHVITANDYLVQRDKQEMASFFQSLELTASVVTPGQSADERQNAYAADIVYTTARELVFDYLRDRVSLRHDNPDVRWQTSGLSGRDHPGTLMLRGLCMAIVDEADSIFLDEACTPLVLSQPMPGPDRDQHEAENAFDCATQLWINRDFRIRRQLHRVELTDAGVDRILARQPDDRSASNRQFLTMVQQALTALHVLGRDEHYVVQGNGIELIDTHTGRIAVGRAWSAGLHQMVERKEGVPLTAPTRTVARITYQQFFSRYIRLAGLSGTLREARRELASVYSLFIRQVPLRQASRCLTHPVHLFASEQQKLKAICHAAATAQQALRPCLVGVTTVQQSRLVSQALHRAGISHRVLNAENHAHEAAIVRKAGQPGTVTVATNMAGRGTDIHVPAIVQGRGGLLLISCQINRERRTDRQLFGRTARRGQPGEVLRFWSLEQVVGQSVCTRLHALLPARQLQTMTRHLTPALVIGGRLRRWVGEKQHQLLRLQLLSSNKNRGQHYALTNIIE